MRPIGFSTGSLAYHDFRSGVRMMHGRRSSVIELSALRWQEIGPLVEALGELDLSQYEYVSVHAPSAYETDQEEQLILMARLIVDRRWPVVVHPDVLSDLSAWRSLGSFLLVENLDKRKPTGRTLGELTEIFEQLPEARLCFDIGHCRQVDPSMSEAYLILRALGHRLHQVHLSEVNSRSTHDPLSGGSVAAFQKVAHLIPETVPIILETPVLENQIDHEMELARVALPCPQRIHC